MPLDILISGGTVIDGTGAAGAQADVGISAGRVTDVGELAGRRATRHIDASGLVVCPGFIDVHTHSDLQLLADPAWHAKVRQGVTTEVLGQDGLGLAPMTPGVEDVLRASLQAWNGDPDIAWDWRSVSDYLNRFDRSVAPNVAMLAPHGTIRLLIVGSDDRPAHRNELERMCGQLDHAFAAGAVGMSAGLSYPPGMFASDEELIELSRAMRRWGGYYAPHLRSYGADALDQYRQAIALAARARVSVHLTHAVMNFPANRGRASELLELVDASRRAGVDVTLDSYPYSESSTTLHSILPRWALAGGTGDLIGRLTDPDVRERIRVDLEERGSDGFHGVPMDWRWVVLSALSREENLDLIGMTVDEAARRRRITPVNLLCDLLAAEKLAVGAVFRVGDDDNVQTIAMHPWHMVASDGIVVGARPHPRAWGSFARFIGYFARDLRILPLEEAIRKMTSLPAWRLGLRDRGRLAPGMAADIVVLDVARVRDLATFEDPRRQAEGVIHLLVNGTLVIDEGRHTGATPGQTLRRHQTSGVADA